MVRYFIINTGRVEGIVKIIKQPNEGERLNQGEILVAPSTDPAWTPLFLKAAGIIIMETCGFLSHSAIVSREYWILGVVNVPNVLSLLKSVIVSLLMVMRERFT